MKKNMGDLDRLIRCALAFAAVMVALYVTSGAVDIVLYVFAGIMLITSLFSVCPLYIPFGISTRK